MSPEIRRVCLDTVNRGHSCLHLPPWRVFEAFQWHQKWNYFSSSGNEAGWSVDQDSIDGSPRCALAVGDNSYKIMEIWNRLVYHDHNWYVFDLLYNVLVDKEPFSNKIKRHLQGNRCYNYQCRRLYRGHHRATGFLLGWCYWPEGETQRILQLSGHHSDVLW